MTINTIHIQSINKVYHFIDNNRLEMLRIREEVLYKDNWWNYVRGDRHGKVKQHWSVVKYRIVQGEHSDYRVYDVEIPESKYDSYRIEIRNNTIHPWPTLVVKMSDGTMHNIERPESRCDELDALEKELKTPNAMVELPI